MAPARASCDPSAHEQPNGHKAARVGPFAETEGMVLVNLAGLDQLESLTLLFDAYRQFYGLPSDVAQAREFLSARLRGKDSLILVASRGDRPKSVLGFVQIYPTFSSLSMSSAWILNDLFVDAPARKFGVATALIEEARRRAAESDVAYISLATQHDNAEAKRLYARLGFVPDEGFEHYVLHL
jgi:ribosomal protein S18 acetylase RimI-like enzyme